MADEPTGNLALPDQEAGFAFRAEMAATNAVLGYWRHMLAVLSVGLVGILIYGLYTNQYRDAQREMSREISEAWAEIPEVMPGAETEEDKAKMRSVADDLMKIGASGKGAEAAEAYLRAAELYRMLDEPDQQRLAFEGAEKQGRGALLFAAKSGLANLDLTAGNADQALAEYQDLVDSLDGYLAQQAMLDMGLAYEHLGRTAEAQSTYSDFLVRWPDAPRAEEARDRMTALSTVGAAPGDEEALEELPTEQDAPEPVPADDAPADEGSPE